MIAFSMLYLCCRSTHHQSLLCVVYFLVIAEDHCMLSMSSLYIFELCERLLSHIVIVKVENSLIKSGRLASQTSLY
jgi:hypothetical protein